MVALAINDMQLNVERQPTMSVSMFGETKQVATGPARVRLDIKSEMIGDDSTELKDLLLLGADQLEIVLRRRVVPPRPQDIQSEAEPAPWRVPPSKPKKAVKTDTPETQPEPEEPTTAQLVEEFGSWS
jgi:hypothetical protein